jgi:hypothetical protein
LRRLTGVREHLKKNPARGRVFLCVVGDARIELATPAV